MTLTSSSRPRELHEFEEVCGEFRGYRLDEEQILVVLRDSCSIVLPSSAQEALKPLRVGQRLAILRISEDSIRVRRV